MLHKRIFFIMASLLMGCGPSGPVKKVDGTSWLATNPDVEAGAADHITTIVLGTTKPTERQYVALSKALRSAKRSSLQERASELANIGIAATHLGDLTTARELLDDALSIMNAIIYDPEKSREIASLPGQERTKVFIGEPHERAICNMYRGLIFMADGEFESARACFRRADMYSPASAVADYGQGKWLSLEYLTALAGKFCLAGVDARLPTEIPDGLYLQPFTSGENTLVIVMAGLTPIKRHRHGGKVHGLTYQKVASHVSSVDICLKIQQAHMEAVSEAPIVLLSETAKVECEDVLLHEREGDRQDEVIVAQLPQPIEEIYLQAVSNGRRDVDALLAAKKQAADTGSGAADAGEIVAAALIGIPFVNLAIYPLFIASTLSRDAASRTDSTADLRSIIGPGYLYMGTLDSRPGAFIVRLRANTGEVLYEAHVPRLSYDPNKVNIVLIRVYG